jgi:hypothetical protein
MTISRILLLLIFAALLGSCTTAAALPQAQEVVLTKMAQTEVTHPTKVKTKSSTSRRPAPKQKSTEASPPFGTSPASPTTPNVGSAEWKEEQAENERKEKYLNQLIQGICRGC